MITYNSSLANSPPAAIDFPMVDAMRKRSPYAGFGSNHQDVLRTVASAPRMEAYKANADYALRQQQAQRDLALAGLRMQLDARNNERDLGVQRLRTMTGTVGDLLSGLYQ